jgi:hypothetical protein
MNIESVFQQLIVHLEPRLRAVAHNHALAAELAFCSQKIKENMQAVVESLKFCFECQEKIKQFEARMENGPTDTTDRLYELPGVDDDDIVEIRPEDNGQQK